VSRSRSCGAKYWRGGRSKGRCKAYGRLAIERHEVDAEAIVAVVRRYELTAYDAAYLVVAARLAAPLATLDAALAAAARVHLAAEPARE